MTVEVASTKLFIKDPRECTCVSFVSQKRGLEPSQGLVLGLRQPPGVEIGGGQGRNCETLTPMPQHVRHKRLTVGVVPGDELEGLVEQQDGQRELQHHHPLIEGEGGDVEHNLSQEQL